DGRPPGQRDVFLPVRIGEGETDVGIAVDVLVLPACRVGEEIDHLLVPVRVGRHGARTNILAVMRGEHAEADFLHQVPYTCNVVAGHRSTPSLDDRRTETAGRSSLRLAS